MRQLHFFEFHSANFIQKYFLDFMEINITEIFYILGICFLSTHELDAIQRREWKLFWILKDLKEETAYIWFLYLHIPLYFLIFFSFGDGNLNHLKSSLRNLIAHFLVFHLFIHLAFQSKQEYRFHGPVSNILIFGAGIMGILYLLTK